MYQNATGPHAHRTSGPHQRPVHPAYAQPRATGPQQASAPHRVTDPQQAVPHRGTGPHQAPPRPPAPPTTRSGSLSPKLVAAAVALAVMGGVGGWLAYDAPASNQYQTVSYAGDNPFTSPVGTDRPDVTPVAAGGERPGETPEMYTEDPAKPACDGASLVRQLEADPDRAAAWADVQRITPAAVGRFVDGLTPVVLRANTAVVDHSYVDRTFQATPAVLAPGTAVFVNAYGQPTVKCFSGNPLTPGTSDDPAVTTIRPAGAVITTNVFHDVVAGGRFTSPGRPDTTGTGPSTGGGDDGGTSGGTGAGGGTTTTPPVTAINNFNGSIALSDGRLQLANGEILPAVPLPEGATRLPSGGWTTKDGKTFNRDGSELKNIPWGQDRFINPEGKVVDAQGNPDPTLPGKDAFLVPNGDGTWTFVQNLPDGTHHTFSFPKEGITGGFGFGGKGDPGVYVPGVNGIVVPPNKIQNVDGTDRPESTKIPGVGTIGSGGVLTPDKKNTIDVEKNALAPENAEGTANGNTGGKSGAETIVDPATGKPVEDAPADKKAPKAGTNTGVGPVDPPVIEPVPAEKVPGNTGVVPPVDETTGSTGTTSGSGSDTGSGSGSATGATAGGSTGTGSGEG